MITASYLNRFSQPDTIVPDPGNPQAWDRYAYGLNNPIYFIDPTGHFPNQKVTYGQDGYGHLGNNLLLDGMWTPDEMENRVSPAYIAKDHEDYGIMVDEYNSSVDVLLELLEFRSTTGTSNTDLGSDIEFAFGRISMGITFTEGFAYGMENAPFTFKSVKWKIPNMLGGKYNIFEFTFLRGISSGEVRTVGRTLGEDLAGPAAFTAGYILTITPNIVENQLTNAPLSEKYYELAVDTTGFWVSEIVGDAVQIGGMEGLSPWVSIPAGIGVDAGIGSLWDLIWYGGSR